MTSQESSPIILDVTDIGFNCTSTRACVFSNGEGTCINGRCKCSLGEHYNENNCYPEFGNCTVRINPKSAIGYKEPSMNPDIFDPQLRSCTTDDNTIFEVHIIGVEGDPTQEVKISARGSVNKPIVLVLLSYKATTWVIQTYVGIYKILYGGAVTFSSVQYKLGCVIPTPKQRHDYPFTDGVDTGDGNTIKLFKLVSDEFGPITSFTGYHNLRGHGMFSTKILLNIGGDPLSTLLPTMNNLSLQCHRGTSQHVYTLQTNKPPYNVTESNGLKDGAVAGIVVSVVLFVAILIIGWLCCMSRVKKPSPPPTPPQRRFHDPRNRPAVTRIESRDNRSAGINDRRPRNNNNGPAVNYESEYSSSGDRIDSERQNQPVFLSIVTDLESSPPAYDTLTPPVETPPPSYQLCLQAMETTSSVNQTTSSSAETTAL